MPSKDYKALDRKYVWHPFTQTLEWFEEDNLVIERARGMYLYDTRGRRYLDGVSSLWCNVHGHRVPEIDAAIRRQLNKVAHSTFLGLTHPLAVELAERLVSIAPRGLRRVFYSDNGSTAMEVALKIAFQYWQHRGRPRKKRFVTFSEAYHGDTIGSVSLGGIDLFHRIFQPLLFDCIQAPTTYAYRCPRAKTLRECGEHCLGDLETILKRQADEIAAVVIEPRVQGAAGMIVQPEGFVRRVRELTRKYGVLLIADEVATGFGRTGTMFASEEPDILALAKGLTGGYLPLAATLVTEEIFETFTGPYERTFFHGHTYTANPLACAAALASLDLFEKKRVLERLQPKIRMFHELLGKLYELEHVGEVRVCGLMAGVELVRNRLTREPFTERIGRRVCLQARRHGVIIRPLGNVVVLMPPLAIEPDQLRDLVTATFDSIAETLNFERKGSL